MTLLIVDDEMIAVQGLVVDIDRERLGFDSVLTANSASQAMNIFLNQPVDILLCDIEMPFGNGMDLVVWVREQYPDTICIFLTCHDEFSFARQAVELNCFDYLLKPVMEENLNQTLERAVQYYKKQQKEKLYREYGKIYIETLAEESESTGDDDLDVLEKVERYIRQHLEDDLSVDILAEIAHLSPSYLSRSFKKKYNMNLVDFITQERMKLAAELLANEKLTITMVSAKSGYNNYTYFTKVFKKTYGKSPREYRQSLEVKQKNS